MKRFENLMLTCNGLGVLNLRRCAGFGLLSKSRKLTVPKDFDALGMSRRITEALESSVA